MKAAFSAFFGPWEAYLRGLVCSGHVRNQCAGHSRDLTIDTQLLAHVLLGDGHSFCPPWAMVAVSTISLIHQLMGIEIHPESKIYFSHYDVT